MPAEDQKDGDTPEGIQGGRTLGSWLFHLALRKSESNA
jgi:hypothetical protein